MLFALSRNGRSVFRLRKRFWHHAKLEKSLNVLDCFRFGRRVFGLAGYYDLDLIIGTMIGHYTQVVFLILFFCEKVWTIYKCFKWNTNTRSCKLLWIGSSIQDYDWTWHASSIFNPIYCEKEDKFWIFGGRKTCGLVSYYKLGLILGTMIGHYTQVSFFFHYCWKWSKYLSLSYLFFI